MTDHLIVSVSGIRGIIGAGLSPAAALAFAAALGTYHQGGRVVLCRDSRPSGLVLRHSVLAALGCRTVIKGGAADGNFEHAPEPLAENLTAILPLVPREKADLGLVLDPDADRLAIIDETGRYIGEELTLALAVACRLRQERGPVVINMSSSRVVEDIAEIGRASCREKEEVTEVGQANKKKARRRLA